MGVGVKLFVIVLGLVFQDMGVCFGTIGVILDIGTITFINIFVEIILF